MKKQIKNYETPEVEIVEINVEKGFATTGDVSSDSDNATGDLGDIVPGAGKW